MLFHYVLIRWYEFPLSQTQVIYCKKYHTVAQFPTLFKPFLTCRQAVSSVSDILRAGVVSRGDEFALSRQAKNIFIVVLAPEGRYFCTPFEQTTRLTRTKRLNYYFQRSATTTKWTAQWFSENMMGYDTTRIHSRSIP